MELAQKTLFFLKMTTLYQQNISLIAFLNIICLFLIPFTINYNVWIYDTLYLFIHEIEPMAFI